MLEEYFNKQLTFIENFSLEELLITLEKNVEKIKEKIKIYKLIENGTKNLLKEVSNF